MKEWTIKVFVGDNEKSDFYKWRNKMPVKARQKLRWVIDYMETTKNWSRDYFKLLTDYEGIGEIRFASHGKQYRPLGCYGPCEQEFTILVGAEEKGDRFNPPTAPRTAAERRKLILQDERYSDEYF